MNLQDSPAHDPFAGSNAVLKIKSSQCADGETDSSELDTTAKFRFAPGADPQITYDETDDMGSIQGQTIITVLAPNLVTVQKTGFTESRMVLETGKSHEALYRTMVGTMDMLLSAIDIRSALDADGGTLNLHYLLEISRNDFSTENILELSVRKDPENL